jgi:hypothetical protein
MHGRPPERASDGSPRPPYIQEEVGPDGGWTDHGVWLTSHPVKFYGVMVRRIRAPGYRGRHALQYNLRDVAGEQMAAIPPAELLQMIRADHARTVKLLRTVEAAALRRGARLPSGEIVTAEFLARYPLINHLEEHVEQLERDR